MGKREGVGPPNCDVSQWKSTNSGSIAHIWRIFVFVVGFCVFETFRQVSLINFTFLGYGVGGRLELGVEYDSAEYSETEAPNWVEKAECAISQPSANPTHPLDVR